MKIGDSNLAEDIRLDIQKKASGVFMWVVLVTGILNREYDHGRIHSLRQRLEEIPGDLHRLFCDILTRDQQNKDELLLCVQWILFARKPMNPEELYFGILSGVAPEALREWREDETTVSDMRRFILNASKGLAEITESRPPTIQFIHESVRDFLLKENGLMEIRFDLDKNIQGQAHNRLKQCCLNTMRTGIANIMTSATGTRPSLVPFSPWEPQKARSDLRTSLKKRFPFLTYAVEQVLYHAEAAENSSLSQAGFLKEFQLCEWIKLDNILQAPQKYQHTKHASLLYVLAEHDAASLIRCHPSRLECFRREGERFGVPFLAAMATNSLQAAQAFFEAQLDTTPSTVPFSDIRISLCGRSFQDNCRDCDIKFDFKFFSQKTVLWHMAKHAPEPAVLVYLGSKQGVLDLNDQRATQFALLFSAGRGHLAVTRFFLENGVSVELEGGPSPLLPAAEGGHVDVVHLLIQNGAHPQVKNDFGYQPLFLAIMNGHEDTARVLLDKGANINATGGPNNRTALLYALKYRHGTILRLLVRNGADVNGLGGSPQQTPLIYAAKHGFTASATYLIEKGASIETRDEDGNTALMVAASNGHGDVIKLLIQSGADVDAKDEWGWTPLAKAMLREDEKTVMLLIEHGAEVNARDKWEQTVLMHAIHAGFEGLVRLLLENGADVNLVSSFGSSAMDRATHFGRERDEIKRILLLYGAKPGDNHDSLDGGEETQKPEGEGTEEGEITQTHHNESIYDALVNRK